MKLSDNEIMGIVSSEEADALEYGGELGKKRAKLLRYYNGEPYGNEVPGQSSAVTTDVADVVEGMLPGLMRMFTQGKYIATFSSNYVDGEDEAKQKQEYANWVFQRDNQGVLILHDMMKDALLQYSGVVKVTWDVSEETTIEKYQGLSELEYQKLRLDPDVRIDDVTQEQRISEDQFGNAVQQISYNVESARVTEKGRIKICNIPPEEFAINKSARDFYKPRFCGHRTPKTRSELIQMGFDRELVESLPADKPYEPSDEKAARYREDNGEWGDVAHSPNDVIYLGEYYTYLDADDDGIAELWQVFTAGKRLLQKEQWDQHPFAVIVPVPIPHKAIGSCPAEQAADLQFRKSELTRQMLDNIYSANYNQIAANERVNLDDLLTPAPGNVIQVEGMDPIQGSILPLSNSNVINEILGAIEYTNTEREQRTGVTRYNQGLDTESLNKTATGFQGIRDMSQMRVELIARLFADTGIREIFRKIIWLASKYQEDALQVRVTGGVMEIDPRDWKHNIDCTIDVGIGAGDRKEKIANLNYILQVQNEIIEKGSTLADQSKIYNTLDKLITEIGLKEAALYFNDPKQPAEQLQAENEQLKAAVQQLQMLVQQSNPLAEQERIRQQGRIAAEQIKAESSQSEQAVDIAAKQEQFEQEMLAKFAELELKYNQDLIGVGFGR